LLSIATAIIPTSCLSSPCYNGGVCTYSQSANTYVCSCSQNYYGARCERMISRNFYHDYFLLLDMNRCYYQPSLCYNGGTCIPGVNGDFSCQCTSSYGGVYCEQFIQGSSIYDYYL
jgi:hypothetical protein